MAIGGSGSLTSAWALMLLLAASPLLRLEAYRSAPQLSTAPPRAACRLYPGDERELFETTQMLLSDLIKKNKYPGCE